MLGYIYHIKNLETGKEYIGQTIDIDWRIYKHFNELEKNKHHSHKLQRSYNLHGKDCFKVEYESREFETYEDLLLAEQLEIEKYNSYENGYNETRGGEGHATKFDFKTRVLLHQIGKRYDGVQKMIGRYYNCDPSTVKNAFKQEYLGMITYDEDELKNLIEEIGIPDSNLKENYKNNYSKQLNEEQIFMILSVIELKKYSCAACAKVFHVNKDVVNNITRGKTYKLEYEKFLCLSDEIKKEYAEKMCNTTDIIRLHYEGQRGPVKNPLTQEQVNYILDNLSQKSGAQIARDLGISSDRVSSVKNKKSYLDMIWVYEKEHSSN